MDRLKRLAEWLPRAEGIEALGVFTLLGINLMTEEKDQFGHFIPKDFEILVEELFEKFSEMDAARQEQILEICEASNGIEIEGEMIDGDRTEDTETSI